MNTTPERQDLVPASLTERCQKDIVGVLSCFDRILISGYLPDIGHDKAMEGLMRHLNVRLFDYPKHADQWREKIRAHIEKLATDSGATIEFIRNTPRKEDHIQTILEKRGTHPGIVHILSAMEGCRCYYPWHDKKANQTHLRSRKGQCLHYYVYFIDEDLGLCHLRLPTWAPFRIQFYFNGHNWLASKLRREKIEYVLQDNAFASLSDWKRAQQLSDSLTPELLHRKLDRWTKLCFPLLEQFLSGYHWSLMQLEYSMDLVFSSPERLRPLYEELSRSAVLAVKTNDVATFLGKRLSPLFEGEAGSKLQTRVEGTRIRHFLGPASLKLYDKHGFILRLETTVNDVSFFKHHRKVKQRDGTTVMKTASVRKTVYSLGVMRELMDASNKRYLRFLSDLEEHVQARLDLDKISRSVKDDQNRSFRGFDLFRSDDLTLIQTLLSGEHNISGTTHRQLQQKLNNWPTHRLSYAIRRLRLHGIIRRIGRTYKYYITKLGQRLLVAALKLKEFILIPTLQHATV
jgi:hypothetical protein